MWVVEYIIEDLMEFSFLLDLDLGLTGSIKCCKLSLFLAQTGPYYYDSQRRSQGGAVRNVPLI